MSTKKFGGLLIAFLLFIASVSVKAGEGMWLPLFLKNLNEAEMQAMGMKLSAEDIYSVNNGSLKDAIVSFGGFCTGEIISSNGLLLTNHHCGFSAIQSHSSLENNYLDDGFWAMTREEEKPNDGLTATFVVRIEEVTDLVLGNLADTLTESQRQSAIDQNINELKQATLVEEYEDIIIRPFFHGNQYFMFVTVTYRDVRLVGAPPSSIGKFGADTDNWEWPRHTGDFSLFRIYASPDNLPADYSPSNVPFVPKHYLPISLDGIEEDDFTMVFGFPGRTNQYLPAMAIDHTVNIIDPARIAIREKALDIMDAAMRNDPEIKIKYASKFASIANGWKKWIGEVQGLTATKAFDKKLDYDLEFMRRVTQKPEWKQEYATIVPTFRSLYKKLEPFVKTHTYYTEIVGRNVEMLRIAGIFRRLTNVYESSGEEGYNNFTARVQSFLKGFYKDYSPEVDKQVFAALMEMYIQETPPEYLPSSVLQMVKNANNDYAALADKIYGETFLTDPSAVALLWEMEPVEALQAIKRDPAYRFAFSLYDSYQLHIGPTYEELTKQIDLLQRDYMRGQMEVFTEKTFYPDANSTLRVTYGQVKGYEPRDAVTYSPVTYLEGVMQKYQPGDYEFDVPARLLELYEKKDYGQYGEDGKMPVCFIGSNHTTGGNSGSPAIDANGNLIGLNFDRVWEGTMSDLYYDPSICRNIMVDARYILFIIDKFAGASHLIEEMKLVHPKG